MKHENRWDSDVPVEDKIVAVVALVFVVAMTALFEMVKVG